MRRATMQKRRAPGRPTPEPSRELTGVFYRAPGVFAMPVVLSVCPNCGAARSALRVRRGLCRRCYHDPVIRNLFRYARDAGRAHDGLDFHGPAEPPGPPVDVRPGPAKVPVLRARAKERRALFVPGEPTLRLDPHVLADLLGGA